MVLNMHFSITLLNSELSFAPVAVSSSTTQTPSQKPLQTFFTGRFYPNPISFPLDYCFLHLYMALLVII